MTNGIGIIGTGWGTRVQVPAFRAAGLDVVALAGSQPEKTQRIADELGVGMATANWRDLLERPDIALVSVVTPPGLHREITVAALEAGKHVLCEKPTALDLAEAQAMHAAAQAHSDQIALIDHELRFLPALRHARQLITDGAIGTVRYAENRVVGNGRADAQRPWTWWSDAEQGGGVLGAIGSHQTDTLHYLLRDDIVAVQGLTAVFVTERPTEDGGRAAVTADDFAAFSLRFSQGSVALVHATVVATNNEPSSLTVYGTQGTLRFSDGKLLHSDSGGAFDDITPVHSAAFPEGISGDFPEGTVYLGHALKAALAGDRAALEPAATFADGVATQQVLDAVRKANDTSWITLT